jgi:uncharacterized protein (TIGR02996 family)
VSDERTFLQTIAANPDDDTARLAFADWLDDQGDTRGPWVRNKDLWEWMKPDAKDPFHVLLARVRRGWSGAHFIGMMGPTVVPGLLNALTTCKPNQVWGIYAALDAIGPDAGLVLPVLLAATKHANQNVRIGAFTCLAGLSKANEEAMRLIEQALDSPEEQVRDVALRALQNPRTGPTPELAAAKLRGFVEKRGPQTAAALAALVNLNAIDESLIPDLIALVRSEPLEPWAFHALGKIGVPAVRPLLEVADSITGHGIWCAAEALQSIGKDAVPILREGLNSEHANTRQLAADVLARLPAEPDSDSVPGVIESLRSKDHVFRHRSFQAIQRLGPASAGALPALLEIVRDRKATYSDRTQAAWAIGAIGPAAESAAAELLRLLDRTGSLLPGALLQSLAQIGHGPSGIIVLLNASRKLKRREYDWVDQGLHNGALRGRSSPPGDELAGLREVILPAYRARTKRSTLTEPAHLALSKPARAVPAIRPFLSDESHETRIVAVWALRHVGTPQAATELLTAMRDTHQVVRARRCVPSGVSERACPA